MSNTNVIATILTFNRKALLCEALDAILEQDGGAPDILIVDNHSTDGTKETVERYLSLPNVYYVDTGENLGGAGGFNYAIKSAMKMGYDRLWIMDDDCVPQKGALSALRDADFSLNGKFGWLSSVAYWTDGELCKLNLQSYRLGKRIKHFERNLIPAQTASFVSLYMQKSAVLKQGLNIADFYMWGDDWEFTRRISKSFPCYVVSESKVIHKTSHNKSNNMAVDDQDRLWRYSYAFRNEVYILRQEGVRGYVHLFLKTGYNTLRILFQSNGCRLEKLKVLYSNTIRGFSFHPEIEFIDKEEYAWNE